MSTLVLRALRLDCLPALASRPARLNLLKVSSRTLPANAFLPRHASLSATVALTCRLEPSARLWPAVRARAHEATQSTSCPLADAACCTFGRPRRRGFGCWRDRGGGASTAQRGGDRQRWVGSWPSLGAAAATDRRQEMGLLRWHPVAPPARAPKSRNSVIPSAMPGTPAQSCSSLVMLWCSCLAGWFVCSPAALCLGRLVVVGRARVRLSSV